MGSTLKEGDYAYPVSAHYEIVEEDMSYKYVSNEER
jgi:hypothetical protein